MRSKIFLAAICFSLLLSFTTAEAASFYPLGDLPGGSFASGAYGVSADGSVVVGYSNSASGDEAFRWTQSGGMVGLGDLPGGGLFSDAFGVSADGSVVVGQSSSASGYEAYRWTQSTGMVGLGDLPGGHFESRAYGVSPDGSVIVGWSYSASGWEAFCWTQNTGMVGLGDLPGGDFSSFAYGVSADGSVIVGSSAVAPEQMETPSGYEAFRWTQSTGMVGLGDLPGMISSEALDVSADGSIVVGRGYFPDGYSEAIIWDSVYGLRFLADVLTADGVDLAGWSLLWAWDISDDGRFIVGYGINPDGNYEAWLADIGQGAVPIPGAVWLLGSGLFGLFGLRRKILG